MVLNTKLYLYDTTKQIFASRTTIATMTTTTCATTTTTTIVIIINQYTTNTQKHVALRAENPVGWDR